MSHQRTGCIIIGRQFEDALCLFKNRDRGYDSEVEIAHVLFKGVEIAIIYDPKTGYCEGVNEFGIGVVNTALMVAHDEAEGKGVTAKSAGKGPLKSKDGPKILRALGAKSLSEAVNLLMTTGGGIKGHTFVSDGIDLVCIECSRSHPARVTKLDPKRVNTRTNHGVMYPDAGYTEGDDYVSSVVRRWEAQKRIQDVKHPEDIGPTLRVPIHEINSPFNPVRDTDKMRTTSQLLVYTGQKPRMILYLIPGHGSLAGVVNLLPKQRKPKIPVRVISYEGEDNSTLEKEASEDLETWVRGYFTRHPKMKPWARIPVVAKSGSGEARQSGGKIEVYPKFWAHPQTTRDWVFTHEIGHWVLAQKGMNPFISLAQDLGVDVWDSLNLPYGQFNFDEAFADCFAAYFLEPLELKARYPLWLALVRKVLG